MNGLRLLGQLLARILISLVFLVNASGLIDRTVPAHEIIERGLPPDLVPFALIGGRALRFVAGLALISHSFWPSAGTAAFTGQVVDFSKNIAILGRLLFVISTAKQPSMVKLRHPFGSS
jgi:hypothetical protein